MTFTAEQRAKGLATRLANKEKRQAAKSSKIGRVVEVEGVKPNEEIRTSSRGRNGRHREVGDPVSGRTDTVDHPTGDIQHTGNPPDSSQERGEYVQRMVREIEAFDWETCPLTEAITKAADMKREYDRISQIVLRRQNPPRQKWICWTQENIDLIRKTYDASNARAILAACLHTGDDGRANFRDDGRFVIENGVRRLKPAFCCNSLCYKAYQQLSRQARA